MVLPLWKGINMGKTYVICDEEGEPVGVTEDGNWADMIVQADPTLHIAVFEEVELVDIEKEEACANRD